METKRKYFDTYLEDRTPSKKRAIMLEGPCQNNCVFCYAADRRKDDFNMSLDEMKEIILDGRKKGQEILQFTGYCEPGLLPYLEDAVLYAKEIGYEKICIVTNGIVFADLKYLKKIVDAGLNGIDVSIHADESLAKKICGNEDAVVPAITALKNASKIKKIGDLSISSLMVVTKENIDYIPKIIEKLISIGVDNISISLAEPLGNARNNFDDVYVPKEKLIPKLKRINELARRYSQKCRIKMPFSLLSYLRSGYTSISIKLDVDNDSLGQYHECDTIGKILTEKDLAFCRLCRISTFCIPLSNMLENIVKGDIERIIIDSESIDKTQILDFLQESKRYSVKIKPFLVERFNEVISSEMVDGVVLDCTDMETFDMDLSLLKNKHITLMIDNNLHDFSAWLSDRNVSFASIDAVKIYLSKSIVFDDLYDLIRSNPDIKKVILSQRQEYMHNKDYVVTLNTDYFRDLFRRLNDLVDVEIEDIPPCYISNGLSKDLFRFRFLNPEKSYFPAFVSSSKCVIDWMQAYKTIYELQRLKKNKCKSCIHNKKCLGELTEAIKYFDFNPKPIN